MTSFTEDGFLSSEIDDRVTWFRSTYPEWFNLVSSVNRFAWQLQYSLSVKTDDAQSLVCGTLYVRALSNYQGAVLLIQRGMSSQARILLRCLLESVFSLVAVSKHKELANDFIKADEIQRMKMLNKVERWRGENLRQVAADAQTKQTKEDLKRVIEEIGAKNIHVEEMAKKAELLDWYLTAYAVFSGAVHSSVRDLEHELALDSSRNIVSLKNQPSYEETPELLLAAIEAMLQTLIAVGAVLTVDTSEFVESHYEQLRKLKNSIAS